MTEQVAAARARWLSEVRSALDQAQRLVQVAHQAEAGGPEMPELIERIEAARRAIRALQLRGQRMPVEFDPEWTRSSGSGANKSDLG